MSEPNANTEGRPVALRDALRRARIEAVCVEELAATVPGAVASAAQVRALARSIAHRLVPAAAGERAVLEG